MPAKLNYHQIKALLNELVKIRKQFDKKSVTRKISLIHKLSKQKINNAESLIRYHDILCFIRGYPDNATIFKIVESELRKFGSRVAVYKKGSRDSTGENLFNSGIINTVTEHPYSLGAVERLLEKHSSELSIDWEMNEEVADNISQIIQHFVAYQENDTLDNDEYLGMIEWLGIARGHKTKGDLQTLVKLIQRSDIPRTLQVHFYDNLEINATWNLTGSSGSRTSKRLLHKKLFYQKEELKKRTKDLRREILTKAVKLRHLSIKEGREKVRDINEVLAVRNRELYPLTYSNPEEVYCYEPGRGMQIYLFGANHDIRLPLETNFGAMLVRNGLPIGYGIAATLFDRVEIAINVFPAFRAGESAFIIEQFFKLFYHHFGSRVYLVRSYQMGDGDDEPLKSGALWFYYKLGFRAVKNDIRKKIELEYEQIKKNRTYRSPIEKLRKLAKSDVFMHIDPEQMTSFQELSLINLGKIVTELAASKFDGDRNRMIESSMKKVCRNLGIKNLKSWSEREMFGFRRFVPLVACIPNLNSWNNKDKKELVAIIRAKGGTCERKYSVLASKHKKFKQAVEKLAADYHDE